MKLASMELKDLTGHEAGRVLLARLYREETGQDMPPVAVTDRGKPYFADSHLHFSVSHTEKRVFCLLADHPVGIDAEEIHRTIHLNLAEKILSPTEKALFDAAADKRETLLKFWVLKEAYAKLTGRGWGSYLYQTDFDPADVKEIDGHYVAVLEEK